MYYCHLPGLQHRWMVWCRKIPRFHPLCGGLLFGCFDVPVHQLFHQPQSECTFRKQQVVKLPDFKFISQRRCCPLAQLLDFQPIQLKGQCLTRPGNIPVISVLTSCRERAVSLFDDSIDHQWVFGFQFIRQQCIGVVLERHGTGKAPDGIWPN